MQIQASWRLCNLVLLVQYKIDHLISDTVTKKEHHLEKGYIFLMQIDYFGLTKTRNEGLNSETQWCKINYQQNYSTKYIEQICIKYIILKLYHRHTKWMMFTPAQTKTDKRQYSTQFL